MKAETSLYSMIAAQGPNLFFAVLVLGSISGICFSLIFPVIIYAFDASPYLQSSPREGVDYYIFDSPISKIAMLFLTVSFTAIAGRTISSGLTNLLAQRMSVSLRDELFRKVSGAEVQSVETIGTPALTAIILSDVNNVVSASLTIPILLNAMVTILSLMGCMAFIDWRSFYYIALFLLTGLVMYRLILLLSERYVSKSRHFFESVSEGGSSLIKGIKELKLSRENTTIHLEKVIGVSEENARKSYVTGSTLLYVANAYGELLVFLTIGLVVFHLPFIYYIEMRDQLAIVLCLVFLASPVTAIFGSMPVYIRGKVSLSHIENVSGQLKAEIIGDVEVDLDAWTKIRIESGEYLHSTEGGSSFGLRNINLEFNRGEATFIIGGNGSGKSTLGKVISTHYRLSSGHIYLGNSLIDATILPAYRHQIAAVFTDFHLFRQVYGLTYHNQERLKHYLQMMELDAKVAVNEDGVWSTLKLSDGQKKRLALANVLLQERDVYIFDEWAADQDPEFKKTFYTKVIPMLALENKVVIVITHDDSYFSAADQIVVMENGAVKRVLTQKNLQTANSAT